MSIEAVIVDYRTSSGGDQGYFITLIIDAVDADHALVWYEDVIGIPVKCAFVPIEVAEDDGRCGNLDGITKKLVAILCPGETTPLAFKALAVAYAIIFIFTADGEGKHDGRDYRT
jgi:hypothetical protein